MRLLKLGARVVLNGREVEVIGFTSMSVVPRRVFLRDLETDETFDIEQDGGPRETVRGADLVSAGMTTETHEALAHALVAYSSNRGREAYLAVGSAASLAGFSENETHAMCERALTLSGPHKDTEELYAALLDFVSLLSQP